MARAFIALFAAAAACRAAALTTAQVSQISAAIVSDFGMTATYGVPCNPCALGDTYGALVRLAFHDAFGEGKTSNGCIDFTAPENNGLQQIVGQLAASRAPFASVISAADFWVLAAQLAIQFSSTPAGGARAPGVPASPGALVLPFVFGRVDAAACNDAGLLPGAGFSWAQSAAFFGSVGLSVTNVVALFGAHALGRAEFQNSGFHGGWTTTQSSFSVAYYSQMLGIPWANNNITAGSDLWLNGGSAPATIRLRSDAEVAISPAAPGCPRFGGRGGAATAGCPFNTATQSALTAFAGSTAAFYAAFAPAWAIMVGSQGAALAAPTAVTPSTTPTATATASATLSRGASPSTSPSRAAASLSPSRAAAAATIAPSRRPAAAAAADAGNFAGLSPEALPIVGGAVGGGLALIALATVAAVVISRRRRAAVADDDAGAAAPAPVTAEAPAGGDPADDRDAVAVAIPVAASGAHGVVLTGIPVPLAAARPTLVRDVSLHAHI